MLPDFGHDVVVLRAAFDAKEGQRQFSDVRTKQIELRLATSMAPDRADEV